MKSSEILRIVAFQLVGTILCLWIQPLLYSYGYLSPPDVPLLFWLNNNYMQGAIWICLSCLAATVFWLLLAIKGDKRNLEKRKSLARLWWMILSFLGVSLLASLWMSSGGDIALLSWPLGGVYILDIIVMYWMPTMTSTPGSLKYAPLGAKFARSNKIFR
jgi:hypothetical protein